MKKSFFLIFLLFFKILAFSQNKNISKNYFCSPLDIPIFLSGSFAEIRNNHFHAGIDIKTQQKEGKNVYATADAYISRIKVSPRGYGNVLYLTHPNGYTTVYAHLQRFNDEIQNFVKKQQYQRKNFSVEIFLQKNQINLKKGDVIAYSGNSGGSQGPHLHFEIRENISQYPLNPLLFNFDIKDNIAPKIKSLAIYPQNIYSSVDNQNQVKNFNVFYRHKKWHTKKAIIKASGKIGLGIETNDFFNNSNNVCGVYSIELQVNNETIFFHQLDKISFYQQKYINAHIDFEKKKRVGRVIQKSFLLPNQKLISYKKIKNKGFLDIQKDEIYNIKYIVKDKYQNTSILKFKIIGVDFHKNLKKMPENSKKNFVKKMPFFKNNFFNKRDIKLSIPKNTLYDTLFFQYDKTINNKKKYYSDIHHIHDKFTPLHKKATISIQTKNLSKHLEKKACIVEIYKNGNFRYIGGKFENGFITTKIRNFGSFAVTVDTIKPKIVALTNCKNANLSNKKKIKFRINDNLSGIAHFKGYIDKKWVLFEYDAKNRLIWYEFDEKRMTFDKKHHLELKVWDKRNNFVTYEAIFFK